MPLLRVLGRNAGQSLLVYVYLIWHAYLVGLFTCRASHVGPGAAQSAPDFGITLIRTVSVLTTEPGLTGMRSTLAAEDAAIQR